jgi:fatty-acyl-CoA synthase
MKDVIKVGGEWLSSLEVEDVLAAHPAVAEVAVIGVSDPKWGEKPVALVVRKPGQEGATERDLQHHAREFVDKGVLPKLAVMLHVRFVDAIEKTSVGKVNKRALREKHGG